MFDCPPDLDPVNHLNQTGMEGSFNGLRFTVCPIMDCFISAVSCFHLQKPLSLSLLKVFGQGLGPREVTQGQEFALMHMFDQGFPGQRLTWHDLRCYRATGRGLTKCEDKTLTHTFSVHGHSRVVRFTFPSPLV